MTAFVLLPGMDGSGTLFDAFVSELGCKTIVVSYPQDRALAYEQLEPIVERSLPIDQPYILLGESFSGPLAIRIASRRPSLLRAVVLVCTFAKLPGNQAPQFLKALFASIPFWRLPVSLSSAALLGRFDSKALQTKISAAIEGVTPAVWRLRLRSVLDVDVTAQLPRVEVPLLYLRASNDRVVPNAACEFIARIHRRTRVVQIEGPHALLQTNPIDCVAAIRAFAREENIFL